MQLSPSQVIVLATPVFLLAIALEYAWGRARGRDTYRLNDAINSISLGMLSEASGALLAVFRIGIYTALPGSAVLLFEGSPADAEVERTCVDRGVRLVRLPGPEALSRSTAASLLAAELWRRVAERA